MIVKKRWRDLRIRKEGDAKIGPLLRSKDVVVASAFLAGKKKLRNDTILNDQLSKI